MRLSRWVKGFLSSGGICRINPVVLGTVPNPCKGHSAIALNEDRILFIKGGSALDDSFWFLEVSQLKLSCFGAFGLVLMMFNLLECE